jgi:hypothetical protein
VQGPEFKPPPKKEGRKGGRKGGKKEEERREGGRNGVLEKVPAYNTPENKRILLDI